MPRSELAKRFSSPVVTEEKITPAGRFTVRRDYDRSLGGVVLDINEIQGKDWSIAIYRVWLGAPSEHRDQRLKSPNDDDRHISFGCINVGGDTMALLLRLLPKGPTPLYVLPRDEALTAEFFPAPAW